MGYFLARPNVGFVAIIAANANAAPVDPNQGVPTEIGAAEGSSLRSPAPQDFVDTAFFLPAAHPISSLTKHYSSTAASPAE
jgi:hypothetical protein